MQDNEGKCASSQYPPVAEEDRATPSMRTLYQQLYEIEEIMGETDQRLMNATDTDQKEGCEKAEQKPGSISLDNLQGIVDEVRRRANNISRSTNHLIGN